MFVENQMTLVVHSVKPSALYIAKIKKEHFDSLRAYP